MLGQVVDNGKHTAGPQHVFKHNSSPLQSAWPLLEQSVKPSHGILPSRHMPVLASKFNDGSAKKQRPSPPQSPALHCIRLPQVFGSSHVAANSDPVSSPTRGLPWLSL